MFTGNTYKEVRRPIRQREKLNHDAVVTKASPVLQGRSGAGMALLNGLQLRHDGWALYLHVIQSLAMALLGRGETLGGQFAVI